MYLLESANKNKNYKVAHFTHMYSFLIACTYQIDLWPPWLFFVIIISKLQDAILTLTVHLPRVNFAVVETIRRKGTEVRLLGDENMIPYLCKSWTFVQRGTAFASVVWVLDLNS